MNPDFVDLLRAFIAADVRFLVVGAYALAVHGRPRATGDLDIWIDASQENASRVVSALRSFGAPLTNITERDLTTPETVFQFGLPPRRIDLLTSLTGVSFGDAWPERVLHVVEGLDVPFIGRKRLVINKRATGRTQDLADLEALGEV
jgi:hypothetical protein